jgi:predicted ferric reductase
MYDIKSRRNILLLYAVFLSTTLILWLSGKTNINSVFLFPYLSLTQISGLFAATLISLNVLLSCRFKFIENLMGGLDKVYKQHQLTGKIAFSLMVAHPIFLLVSASNIVQAINIYLFDLSYAPYNYGKLALLSFIILISLTIFIKLPFHVWRRTHQLMIIPLVFASLHVATIESDVGSNSVLTIWVLGLLVVSIAMYVYKVILYKFIGPKFEYRVQEVSVRGFITEIILAPIGKVINYEPGQFVFAVFKADGISDEEHPFSISSSPTQENVRLSIKQSGDFTSTLPKLKKGAEVLLYGPYGEFGKKIISSKKDVVLIAGGIGITPFLSTVQYIKDMDITKNYKFVYSYKNEKDSTYKEALAEICGDNLFTNHSDKNGHLTAQKIDGLVGGVKDRKIFICGPKPMMRALTSQFLKMGIKKRDIIFEDFDLKG